MGDPEFLGVAGAGAGQLGEAREIAQQKDLTVSFSEIGAGQEGAMYLENAFNSAPAQAQAAE